MSSESISKVLKVFGMSNMLMETELSSVESRFGVQLREKRQQSDSKDEIYYPQFGEAIRQQAHAMSEHYEVFYCLENTIRSFVSNRLRETKGDDWWSKSVPKEIQQEVSARIQREIDSGITPRSERQIDFSTFGELALIIRENWEDFEGLLNSKLAVQKVLTNLNHLRAPIAHCCPLASDEATRLKISVRDWFRLMDFE